MSDRKMSPKRLAEEIARVHGETTALAAWIFDDQRYGDINDELQSAVLHLTTALTYARNP